MDIKNIMPREARALNGLHPASAAKEDRSVFWAKLGGEMKKLNVEDLDPGTITSLGKLKESTEQLEGVLVKQLLDVMNRSMPKNQFDGPMSDMAKDMMSQSMADDLGKRGQFGLGASMYRQLSRPILSERLARLYIEQNKVKP